ncbi:MAG: BACON domain-containing carbohydrate-binding protein [Acidobacteriota bacterium]
MQSHSKHLVKAALLAIGTCAAAWSQPCTFTILPAGVTVSANGGTGNITVTASAPDCARTAVSTAEWITVTAGASGTGNGLVSWAVAANQTLAERTGTILVGGRTFTVTQAAGTCSFDVSPRSANYSAAGGTGSFNMTTQPSCSWTAVSSAPWLTITSAASGAGTATIIYAVAANTSVVARSATITVGSQTYAVTQGASSCLSLSSSSAAAPAAGGSGGFNVIASADCSWVPISNADWLTITSGASGVGPGTVTYSVAANPSPITRSGTISIGSLTFTVNQLANVCFSLPTTSATAPVTGGTGSFSVAATEACSWTVVSNAEWLTITSGAAGYGPGTVIYSAAPNTTTAPRTGVITVGSQTFTVTQAAACLLSFNPTSGSYSAAGGSGSITVTASGSGCDRAAVSDSTWITITAGASGTGSGAVSYAVAGNTTAQPRTGTLTIGGQPFTVTQAATSCTTLLTPPSRTMPAAGGSGSFTVTTGCSWTAVSNKSDWLQVTGGASGAGNGAVSYWVGSNPSSEARTGAITVADQTFNVSQLGVTCGVSLLATSASFPATGGPGAIEVTAAASCAWTAASAVPWITITTGAPGSGDGTVRYSVAANTTGQTRSSTITIGDQVFVVTQAGTSCAFSLSSTGTSVPAAGGAGTFNVSTTCSWSATPSAGWITISSGASGSGDGSVAYSAAANPGSAARIGTITVGSQAFTISQPGAACAATLTPASASVPGISGTGTLNVTAPAGCTWTPASESEWLKIATWSSVSGAGVVNYSYASNPAQAPRTGAINVSGQIFTLTQGSAEVRVYAVANAASGARGLVAPGLIVTIGGAGMGPAAAAAAGQTITTSLAGTRVLFDNVEAPVLYTSDAQVNAIAPYALDGKTSAALVVEYQGVRSNPMTLNVAAAAPGLFTADASGAGQGAVLNQDYSVNSAANAAARGSVIMVYATGEGQTVPPGVDGRPAGDVPPRPVLPVTAQIGGIDAEVRYAGGAPGLVAGLMQVNVVAPARAATGSAIPVVLRVGAVQAQTGVTVALK